MNRRPHSNSTELLSAHVSSDEINKISIMLKTSPEDVKAILEEFLTPHLSHGYKIDSDEINQITDNLKKETGYRAKSQKNYSVPNNPTGSFQAVLQSARDIFTHPTMVAFGQSILEKILPKGVNKPVMEKRKVSLLEAKLKVLPVVQEYPAEGQEDIYGCRSDTISHRSSCSCRSHTKSSHTKSSHTKSSHKGSVVSVSSKGHPYSFSAFQKSNNMTRIQLPFMADIKCPICSLNLDYVVIRLKCGHEFHEGCFKAWYRKNGKCSECKV